MRKQTLSLIALSALALADASSASDYKVVYEQNSDYHILINIVEDVNLLSAIQGEAIFQRITREVCGANDCTARFWLSESYAAKTSELSDQNRKAIVAEYRQTDGRPIMISHKYVEAREAGFEDAACVKEVFNAYCLGGSVSDLPPHVRQQKQGEIDRRYYGTDTAVFSVRGKVASVIRVYPDMSWLKFRSTEIKLSDLCGSGKDLSYYPNYADDDSSRATAIRLGRAQVVKTWQLDGWTIRWSWAEEYGRLSYSHDALMNVFEAEDPGEGL